MKSIPAFLVLASAGLLACSGGEFGSAPAEEDSSGDLGTDSSTDPDTTDSTPADSPVPDTRPETGDTCVLNECGGCTTLSGKKGDACGTCGGALICDGLDALKCDGSKPKNECGGCVTLTGKKGDPCETCGKLDCDGLEALKCVDGAPKNECGGCKALTGKKGDACGTACGALACGTDKESLACIAATPAPGTVCGICSTSSYACTSPGVTTCTKSDDRLPTVDPAFGPGGAPVPDSFDDVKAAAIAYKTRIIGSIKSIELFIKKKDVTFVPGVATLTLKVFKGALGSGTLLGSATVTDAGIPTSGFSPITFTLTTPTVDIAAGSNIYIEISSDIDRYAFFLDGNTTSPPPTSYGYSYYSKVAGSYGLPFTYYPIITVNLNGCP